MSEYTHTVKLTELEGPRLSIPLTQIKVCVCVYFRVCMRVFVCVFSSVRECMSVCVRTKKRKVVKLFNEAQTCSACESRLF